jgi:hypothetical protein
LNRLTVKQLLNAQLPSFTAGPSAAAPVVVPPAGHEVAVRAARFMGKFAEEFPEPSSFHHQTGYGKKMEQITGKSFMICGLQLSGILV